MYFRPQRTLQKEISFSGVGIHTGKIVTLSFCPAPANTGVVFQRIDLPSSPSIPAEIGNVLDTSRCTTIGVGGCHVQTVEHVLAALSAFQIDNLYIQMTEAEPPIGDGSSSAFVRMIEEAGIREQADLKKSIPLKSPIYFSQGETHLVALPSEEFRISYTMHYPKSALVRSQFFSIAITPENFKKEIAPCRTFALYEELTALIERGLIRGGSLENAIVIKDDVILSKEGLRFSDEMVRHKILDLVGDLALIGFPFLAHIIAIRSGHATNVALGKKLAMHFASHSDEGNR